MSEPPSKPSGNVPSILPNSSKSWSFVISRLVTSRNSKFSTLKPPRVNSSDDKYPLRVAVLGRLRAAYSPFGT